MLNLCVSFIGDPIITVLLKLDLSRGILSLARLSWMRILVPSFLSNQIYLQGKMAVTSERTLC